MKRQHLVSLTDEEINFMLWCLGYVEGTRAYVSESSKKFVLENVEALRIKLMDLE